MKSSNEFEGVLGTLDTLLTISLAVLTIGGGCTLLTIYSYQDSLWSYTNRYKGVVTQREFSACEARQRVRNIVILRLSSLTPYRKC